MKYEIIPPSARLLPFVRFFWILENDEVNGLPYIYRSLADGCAELLFHYKGSFVELIKEGRDLQALSMVHAQSKTFRRFETKENFGIFGAYLYPFAIPYLFSIPSCELSNQMPDLQTLSGFEGKMLEERVIAANDNIERLQIVSAFLEKKLCGIKVDERGILSSIRYLIDIKGATTIDALADKYCLSERQFERKFKLFSGFSPKLFTRIIRFGHASLNLNVKDKTLSEIAQCCGYYDQSHFIHEFKEFSGYSPKEYYYGTPEGGDVRQA